MLKILEIVAIVVVLITLLALTYIKVPPNVALIISGFRKDKNTKRSRILTGGATLRIPFLERVDKLSLNIMQMDIKTSRPVPTIEYIDIYVDGVANVKIKSDVESISNAAEKFLGMKQDSIARIAQQVLEANLRDIVGSMKITELVTNKELISQKAQESAAVEMEKMGLEIVNFAIQGFRDENGVLENLGVDNVAKISKDAQIARAEAEKEVAIKKAEAAEEANKAKAEAEIKIAEQDQEVELKKAELKKVQDTKRAEADAAYKIQEQEQRKTLESTSVAADISRREKEIELRDKEIRLAEQALEAQVKKQAEADKYRTEQLAEAELFERVKKAEALKAERELEAEADIKVAEAKKQAMFLEAEGIEKIGLAEAKAIEAKAEAQKKMGEASVVEMYFNILPELVRNASEPLSKTEKIVMYGEGNSSKLVKDTTNIVNQITESFGEAAGIDVKGIMNNLFKKEEVTGA